MQSRRDCFLVIAAKSYIIKLKDFFLVYFELLFEGGGTISISSNSDWVTSDLGHLIIYLRADELHQPRQIHFHYGHYQLEITFCLFSITNPTYDTICLIYAQNIYEIACCDGD